MVDYTAQKSFTSIKTSLARSLLYALVSVELIKWIGLAQLYTKC